MAQFFFHHQECGGLVEDPEGQECPDVAAAEQHAFTVARRIVAREVVEHGELCLGCSVDVHDAHGQFVTRVAFRRAVLVTGL